MKANTKKLMLAACCVALLAACHGVLALATRKVVVQGG